MEAIALLFVFIGGIVLVKRLLKVNAKVHFLHSDNDSKYKE